MQLSVRRASQTVQDAVRSQLWPLPLCGVVIAVALGVLVPVIDVAVDSSMSGWADAAAFSGDAGAARTVLDAVASSLITVTSLTFSLTVVTLQLASSQFSPRLLRTFTQDLFVQITLTIFLATFVYALTVLRSVRSVGEGGSAFVPRIAVSFAFVLAVASVIALVLFLAHLTRQIRVETMLARVRRDAADTMAAGLVPREGPDRPRSPGPRPIPGRRAEESTVWAARSGFVISIDHDRLIRAAEDTDAVITIEQYPGRFVVEGTPLGHVTPSGTDSTAEPADWESRLGAVRRCADRAVRIGTERTAAQDVEFGLRQIVDIVNKALSPGVNDPTTAIHGLAQASALLCDLTRYETGPLVLTDDEDRVRVVVSLPTLDHYIRFTLGQPSRYGASDPQVMTRLYELLGDLTWHIPADSRSCLVEQLDQLDRIVAEQDFAATQAAEIGRLGQEIRTRMEHPGPQHRT